MTSLWNEPKAASGLCCSGVGTEQKTCVVIQGDLEISRSALRALVFDSYGRREWPLARKASSRFLSPLLLLHLFAGGKVNMPMNQRETLFTAHHFLGSLPRDVWSWSRKASPRDTRQYAIVAPAKVAESEPPTSRRCHVPSLSAGVFLGTSPPTLAACLFFF